MSFVCSRVPSALSMLPNGNVFFDSLFLVTKYKIHALQTILVTTLCLVQMTFLMILLLIHTHFTQTHISNIYAYFPMDICPNHIYKAGDWLSSCGYEKVSI